MYSIFNRCLSVRGRCGIVCGLFVCSPLSSKPVHYKTLKLTNRKSILHQKCVKSLVSNFLFLFFVEIDFTWRNSSYGQNLQVFPSIIGKLRFSQTFVAGINLRIKFFKTIYTPEPSSSALF